MELVSVRLVSSSGGSVVGAAVVVEEGLRGVGAGVEIGKLVDAVVVVVVGVPEDVGVVALDG